MTSKDLAPTTHAVLEYILSVVVTQPEAINVDAYQSDDSAAVYMDVSVGSGDMGRVIGKRGRMANTIRSIVSATSMADDCLVEVEFIDE